MFKKEGNFKTVYRGDILFEFATTDLFEDKNRFNPLVALPSPRDILDVREAVDLCLSGLDRVWFKYWPQSTEPYRHIRDYFLKRTQYTHLIILPDDLVVNVVGVTKMLLTVYAAPTKYTVLMGNCSVTYGSLLFAITHNLPSLQRQGRTYHWWTLRDLEACPTNIVQVQHCGTPFAILAREVVEKVSFKNDREWNNDTTGFSEDVVLSWELHNLGIPIYVDTSVIFTHLKGRKDVPPV